MAVPGEVNFNQEKPTILIETYSIHREQPRATRSYRQSPPIIENKGQIPAPRQPYLTSAGSISPFDRIESCNILKKEKHEPSSPQYKPTLRDKSTHQPALELLLTSAASPAPGSKSTGGDELLQAMFDRTAYYGSQPAPELALAPVESQARSAPPTARQETRTETTTREASAPDIDTIARNVYSLLRRRLARERERALGLS
jgi:hypothetical protein